VRGVNGGRRRFRSPWGFHHGRPCMVDRLTLNFHFDKVKHRATCLCRLFALSLAAVGRLRKFESQTTDATSFVTACVQPLSLAVPDSPQVSMVSYFPSLTVDVVGEGLRAALASHTDRTTTNVFPIMHNLTLFACLSRSC
jgi:hypothetical protein